MAKTCALFNNTTSKFLATLNDREVFKQRMTGWYSPRLPTPSIARSQSLFSIFPHAPYINIQMACNDRINSRGLYSTPSTHRGFSARLFPNIGLNSDEARSHAFTNSWGPRMRSGHIVDLPRSVEAEGGFGKYNHNPLEDRCLIHDSTGPVSMATSHEALTVGRDDLQYSQSHLPASSQYGQPYPATTGQDHSFTRPVARETRPIDYLERGGSRPTIGRFNTVNLLPLSSSRTSTDTSS